MHPSILAKRKALALDRIIDRATALVQHLDLDPALAESLQPKGIKDPQAAEMIRLEALADLLDQLAGNDILFGVTAVTDEAGREAAVGTEEPEPAPEPTGVATTDDLPPPVVGEPSSSAPESGAPIEAERKSTKKSTRSTKKK